MGKLVILTLESPLRIEAATCQDQIHLAAAHKTHRSIAGISEGEAGAQEMIEPCPQRRGHAEVDHRCGDDDRVRRREFGVVAGRKRDRTRLSGASLVRSEEHTSELQSLMRISYAGLCLKK